MRLVLQTLSVVWTKASRGAPGAGLRNAVPEHLLLPDEVLTSNNSWRHEEAFHELFDFEPQTRHLSTLDPEFDRAVGLELERNDDGDLRCYFVWSAGIGQPDRSTAWPRRFAFTLSPGQTGRLRFNGRLSFEQGWQYQKFVHNIAWVASCDADIFGQVDHQFDSMEVLR